MTDKIYEDFTTKLLPKIAEGLTITKDYFGDLFGRYIKYLIVQDSLFLGITLLLFVIIPVILKLKFKALLKWSEDSFNPAPIFIIIGLFAGIGLTFGLSIYNATNLIKDIYIPEIRIYEQIQGINK